jgi:hypothetical protein
MSKASKVVSKTSNKDDTQTGKNKKDEAQTSKDKKDKPTKSENKNNKKGNASADGKSKNTKKNNNVDNEKKDENKDKKSKKSKSKKSKELTTEERQKLLTAPNAATAMVNCVFNVKTARNELLKYANSVLNFGCKFGSIKAQYAYAAISEILALYLVRSSGKYNAKNTNMADLYEIDVENIRRSIRESKEFDANTKELSDSYNPTSMNYMSSFFVSEKLMKVYLEDKAFTNTTNVHITNEALNFIFYVLSNIMSSLTKFACLFSQSSKKSNILSKNYKYACTIMFSGEILNLLHQRLDEIETILSTKKEDKADDNDGNDNTSNNKKKKETKQNKSNNLPKDDNNEANNDDDDDIEDDDNDDNNDDNNNDDATNDEDEEDDDDEDDDGDENADEGDDEDAGTSKNNKNKRNA